MSARFIIFDGHIPVVFPSTLPFIEVVDAVVEQKLAGKASASGECFYDAARGWYCRTNVVDVGYIPDPESAEILNRYICL